MDWMDLAPGHVRETDGEAEIQSEAERAKDKASKAEIDDGKERE